MENANNEVKTPKTTKQKVIFGLKIGGNVIFYLVIIFLFLFSIMNINAGSKNGGFPNIFGKGFLSVKTPSMERTEDAMFHYYEDEYSNYKIGEIKAGDLVYVDVISKKQVQKLKEGDVITFYDTYLKALNTHRIVAITYNEDGTMSTIYCQGDKVVSEEGKYDVTDGVLPNQTVVNSNLLGNPYNKIQVIGEKDFALIKGKVTGVNRGGGKVLDNIQQNWLFYFVIPVLALLLFEVFMVIKNVTDLRNEKAKAALATDKDAMMAEIEAEREKIRQELLKEMGMAPTPTPVETPTEAPVEETSTEEVVEETPVEEVVDATDNTEEVKVEEEETKTE